MDISEIILNNQGKIINEGKNIFEYWTLECQKGHQFKLLANDLKKGEWCSECDKIDKILRDIPIKFNKNYYLEGISFKYVIEDQNRKFIIDNHPFTKEKYKIANKLAYNIIVIHDNQITSLKDQIWEALRDNKSTTNIGEKTNNNSKHHCINQEIIKFINQDTRSLVKRALKPYPELVNKAVGYIRVSTDRQVAEGHSIEAQEANLAIEASKRNFFLKAIYIEEGISGKDIEHREALKRMMTELEAGDRVIVYAVERFARHLKDLLTLADEIEKKGCILIIPEMDIDFTTPQGGMMLAIRGSFAQYEREITSKRVKDTLSHLKSIGKYVAKPKFGWRVNPDKSSEAALYIRDEEEQKIITNIRLLRERYPQLGITAFTKKVNEAGVKPPRKATVWYHKFLKDLMIREGIMKK